MRSRTCAAFAAVLAVLLTAVPFAGAEDASPASSPTKYLGPLRKHTADLQGLRQEFQTLLDTADDGSKERKKKTRAAAENLYRQGMLFGETLEGFIAGETRRGLSYEIDLVRHCVGLAHEMLVDYRRLLGIGMTEAAPTRRPGAGLGPWVRDLIRQELQRRIAARFDDVHVRALLTSQSRREALEYARDYLGG